LSDSITVPVQAAIGQHILPAISGHVMFSNTSVALKHPTVLLPLHSFRSYLCFSREDMLCYFMQNSERSFDIALVWTRQVSSILFSSPMQVT